MTIPIAVLLPVRNEEANLAQALASAAPAQEVWVVDSQSSDRTLAIAESFGARTVQFHYQGGWPKKKNWALDTLPLGPEWVFILDADERFTPELWTEIEEVIASGAHEGYFVDRDYIFLGRSLRCFRPNWNLRLFRRGLARYERLTIEETRSTGDNEVHEHPSLQGSAGYLRHPLIHHDLRPLSAWFANHDRYSTWEAEVYEKLVSEPMQLGPSAWVRADAVQRKRMLKRIWVRLPARPLLRFLWFYLVKRAILDGYEGFLYSQLMGFYEVSINAKLRERRHARTR